MLTETPTTKALRAHALKRNIYGSVERTTDPRHTRYLMFDEGLLWHLGNTKAAAEAKIDRIAKLRGEQR